MLLPPCSLMRPSGPVGVPFQPPIWPVELSLPLQQMEPPLRTVMLTPLGTVSVLKALGVVWLP